MDSPWNPEARDETAERLRLEALDRYDLLDSPREEAFDRVCRLAKSVFQVAFATVSLIDAHRQWFKACEGLSGTEAPRDLTFCARMIAKAKPLIVPDATLDPVFSQNPFVTGEPWIRFYAGVPLQSADGHVIGSLCVSDPKPHEISPSQIQILEDLARVVMEEFELRLTATTDVLTGVLTRRAFKEQAARAVALAVRHHHDLSCISFDLDHFKRVNDTYGHAGGDRLLVGVVRRAEAAIRRTDLLGRLGGEEFAILLPGTRAEGAWKVAEKVRSAIEGAPFEINGTATHFTASFGVSSLGGSARDLDGLLDHADRALYRAKEEGRNRCAAYAQEGSASRTGRRVLKAGHILFHARGSSVDCTVRRLSDEGAGLDVSTSTGVPTRFELAIDGHQSFRACRVVRQTATHLEVAFS